MNQEQINRLEELKRELGEDSLSELRKERQTHRDIIQQSSSGDPMYHRSTKIESKLTEYIDLLEIEAGNKS